MNKSVKILLGCRIVLWLVALGSTIYWIHYSFKLYSIGVHDVYEYASYFRPVFSKALLVTFISLVISYILRGISDRIKNIEKYGKDKVEE